MKVKVEINTCEHDAFADLETYPFAINNGWFTGQVSLVSFSAEELFATKLRAFLQRNKNRDLFDLWQGLHQLDLDRGQMIMAFTHYMATETQRLTRAVAEQRMLGKLSTRLVTDVTPLLPNGVSFTEQEAMQAFSQVWYDLVARLDGESWKHSQTIIDDLRATTYPDLLR